MTAGFTNAFTNANEAQLALAENPLDSDVEELAGWLFGASTNYAIAQTRLQNVGNIPQTFTSDSMAIVGISPTSLLVCIHTKKDLETNKSDMANIVVYCNLNRYQKTNRRDGALYDPDSKVYQALSDSTFQSCKSGVAISGIHRPLALTNNYKDLQKVASKVFGRVLRDG